MAYDVELKEASQSAVERWAKAHELAHIVCDHEGSEFIFNFKGEGDGWRQSHFDRWLEGRSEQEAEIVAAYLLVPREALLAGGIWKSGM